ncbi:hypothetical protein BH24CHL1_BH24CHL1_16920 [soil metagenome]
MSWLGLIVSVGHDDGAEQEWFVFRANPFELPNRELVDDLDRSWHRVRRVTATVAFPLNDSHLAVMQQDRPVSVYFPSETRTGHSFLINADFYLDLDRRHVSDTPQARPYNHWLAGRVATFFGQSVLPELVRLFPEDYRVVHICAPVGSPSGFGEVIASQLREQLVQTRFVPTPSGSVTPRKLLCSPVPVEMTREWPIILISGLVDRALGYLEATPPFA